MSYIVTTDFPGSNVCDISVNDQLPSPEIQFTAHPHGGTEALWFFFRIARTGGTDIESESLTLVLNYADTLLGAGNFLTMRPVVRNEGQEWQRMDQAASRDLPDGRCQITWVLPAPKEHLDVAWCFPYGLPERDGLLTDGRWQGNKIGVSQKGRPILRLSNRYGGEKSDRPGIYCVAQQHAAETPGAWVLHGFLQEMGSAGDSAPTVWAVPSSNVDGVVEGDYGKDPFPHDLNRAWGSPPMRHETLVIQQDMVLWANRCRPVLGLDFHSPGACEDKGVYAFLPRSSADSRQQKAAAQWAETILSPLAGNYAAEPFSVVPTYPSRWGTDSFAEYCWHGQKICGMTTETPYGMIGDRVLMIDDYLRIGRKIAQGLLEYF